MYKSSTIFGSKFLVLKSRLIHRKIRYFYDGEEGGGGEVCVSMGF